MNAAVHLLLSRAHSYSKITKTNVIFQELKQYVICMSLLFGSLGQLIPAHLIRL